MVSKRAVKPEERSARKDIRIRDLIPSGQVTHVFPRDRTHGTDVGGSERTRGRKRASGRLDDEKGPRREMRTFFEADACAESAREGASAESGEMFLLRRPRVVLQVLQRLQGELLLDARSRARGGNRKGAPCLKKGIHRRELLHQRALGLLGECSVSLLPSPGSPSLAR